MSPEPRLNRRRALGQLAGWACAARTTLVVGGDAAPADAHAEPLLLNPLAPVRWPSTPSSAALPPAASPPQPVPEALAPPAEGDFSAAALADYQARLLAHAGGDVRRIPLDVKAEFFDWVLWRYGVTEYRQVHNRVQLGERPDERPAPRAASDTSTWNGALLAALSYQYAATHEPAVLARIETLLGGLHFYQTVTGQPGCVVRCICPEANPDIPQLVPQKTADGHTWYVWGDPAKGTYNQLVAGYSALHMLAAADLPAAARSRAHEDLSALVLHVVDHKYRICDASGRETTYGDLTPLVGSAGVPFNAQVAYSIVAAGQVFPPTDAAARERIAAQFRRLRGEHHAYYDKPFTNLVLPQRIGASPLVKGMNDRFHVLSAAYYGLALELFDAPRRGESFNEKFVYRLGRTVYHGAHHLRHYRNSLLNFMCAGILADERVLACVVPRDRADTRAVLEQLVATGIEQLRHFPLDRFSRPGREAETNQPQWADRFRPDDFYWKCDPTRVWQSDGPSSRELFPAIDFLYAYWLLRYHRLHEWPGKQAGVGRARRSSV